MTKEQKAKQIANLIGMLESQQNEFLADGSDVDTEVSQAIDITLRNLNVIWGDVMDDEYAF